MGNSRLSPTNQKQKTTPRSKIALTWLEKTALLVLTHHKLGGQNLIQAITENSCLTFSHAITAIQGLKQVGMIVITDGKVVVTRKGKQRARKEVAR